MSKVEDSYQEKAQSYFENVRREILPLLPKHVEKIFEVGCGAGDTLTFLKHMGRCDWVGGIENFHAAAELAKSKVNLLLEGSIENSELPFAENSLDVILCLDVLEHLVDPWAVIRRLHALLKPKGILICSIPNVRNFRVVMPLLFLGVWRYSELGLLDKTHLRFFTKSTAIELMESSGLIVDMIRATGLEGNTRLANLVTFSLMKPLFEFQYLLRAVKK